VDAYKKVSVALQAYCDAAATSGVQRVAQLRVLPFVGAAAAVAALAFFLLCPHTRMLKPAAQPAPAIASADVVHEAEPALPHPPPHINPHLKLIRVRHLPKPPQTPQLNWPLVEPAVQIAIPAEALFPLGAVPQGVDFVADLSIAPDGSAKRLRLEPQLIRFERSR